MRNILIFSLILSLSLSLTLGMLGCKKDELIEKEEEKPPPPPKTVEELSNEMNKAIAPLISMADNDKAGHLKTEVDMARDEAIKGYRSTKGKNSDEQNLPPALAPLPGKASDLVRKARDTKRWFLLKAAVELYTTMKPGDNKYDKLVERADIMIARPVVKVRGFFDVDNELYAFLEVFDPVTKKTDTFKVREGEDLNEKVQLIRIIGNKQAVELLYKIIDDPWVVQGPNQ